MDFPVPHYAKMQRVWETPYHEVVIWTWTENGQQFGYKLPVTPGLFEEIYEFGSREPVQTICTLPIQAPPPPPPPEPASLFAKRELTEDELLDSNLFNPLAYEPVLDRMMQ